MQTVVYQKMSDKNLRIKYNAIGRNLHFGQLKQKKADGKTSSAFSFSSANSYNVNFVSIKLNKRG